MLSMCLLTVRGEIPRRCPIAAAISPSAINPDPVYLQSTGFVLDPGGKVIVSVYSSGAIGRLAPDDVVGLVRYLRGHSAPATV